MLRLSGGSSFITPSVAGEVMNQSLGGFGERRCPRLYQGAAVPGRHFGTGFLKSDLEVSDLEPLSVLVGSDVSSTLMDG